MSQAAVRQDAFTYTRGPVRLDADALVREHRELVRRIAWHVHSGVSSRIELEDLVQIGLVALVEAARGFEERGAAFRPYAATRVRGAMIDHLRREARLSRGGMVNRRKLAAARAELESRIGRHASDAELAEALGLAPDEYHALVASTQALEQDSIDEVYADDQPWFADLGERVDERMEREQLLAGMAAAIGRLPEREAMVLQLYFVEELNLNEIGEVLNVGAARVCQLKKAALDKLRRTLEARD
ncbi:FliA/WhiG family RNA polymerase sigma factor [Sphingomonas ginkgonis]|uniref:FliA/WhiG family RNA polymerase sigma factor n=1 Tax=Sphingomonas ginkgonis TaxID=2315330 RepID=A0A3R9WTN0_9SPHN|nr:FliA/WhiG family RNA polymerase sigma factor [Sphingomonas ginkgonis]RST31555.1 FliA/WhiG family RNA polymerase sigma factor [Sphingomonas ginkgonis]